MSVCLSGLNLQTLGLFHTDKKPIGVKNTNEISLFSQLLPLDSNEIKERLNHASHIFRLRKRTKKCVRCKATVKRKLQL